MLYVYDLPKKQFTSIRLAEIIKDLTGYSLTTLPQVQRDSSKPFFNARIKIEEPGRFYDVAHSLRYFSFMGAPCRTLPYQQELLGSNVLRLSD